MFLYHDEAKYYIINRFHSLQEELIEKNSKNFLRIKSPSEKIQELALSKDPKLLSLYPKKFSPEIKEKYSHFNLAGDIGILD